MRIWGVVVIMIVIVVMMAMVMAVIMVVTVVMMVVVMRHFQPADPGTEGIAMRTILDIRPRRVRTLPLNMVVMAFLNRADFRLKT